MSVVNKARPDFHSAVSRHKQLSVLAEEGETRQSSAGWIWDSYSAFELVLNQGFEMFLKDFQVAAAQVCKQGCQFVTMAPFHLCLFLLMIVADTICRRLGDVTPDGRES